MFTLLSLLITGSVADDNFNQNYTTNQTVRTSTTFRSCTFRSCTSSSDGGALYLNNAGVNLGIIDCVFTECSSDAAGGAVRVDSSLWCALNETAGSSCQAKYNGFCYLRVPSSSEGTLTVSESSASLCTCEDGTLWLGGLDNEGASPAYIGALNSSANDASSHASGLWAAHFFDVVMCFCTLSRNTQGNCMAFGDSISASSISCVGLFGNSCSSSSNFPGLVLVCSTVTLSNCVFLANSFDRFIGRSSGSGAATFSRCVFDFPSINTTGAVSFTTTMCTYAPGAALAVTFGGCPWPDPTATWRRSPTPIGSQSPAPTATRSSSPNPSPTPTRSPSPAKSRTPSCTVSSTPTATASQGPFAESGFWVSVAQSPLGGFSGSAVDAAASIRPNASDWWTPSHGFEATEQLRLSDTFAASANLTGSAAAVGTAPLSGTALFTATWSSRDDGRQTSGPLGIGPLVGIAAAALVLIVGVSLAVWRLTRGRAVSVTSSMPAEMTANSLLSTEAIDFGARTFDTVTTADEIGTGPSAVDADESMAPTKNLAEDFL